MLIHWFRRDLRVRDNTALAAAHAASDGAVIPLFIIDPALLKLGAVGAARVHWMCESLRDLDSTLRSHGGRLIMRRGEPLAVLSKLLRETGAQGVVWNRDYSPRAILRDSAIKEALQQEGWSARSYKDQVVLEMDELLSGTGKPYSVYAPYRRAWNARVADDPSLIADRLSLRGLRFNTPNELASDDIPTAADLGFKLEQTVIEPGETAGQARLKAFVSRTSDGIGDYAEGRNDLGVEGTSRMAPHLRWGTVSVRACVRAAQQAQEQADDTNAAKGSTSWIGELTWRDFYQQVLYHYPKVLERPFKQLFVDFPFDNDEERFAAWCAGRTGYPIIDAAMRQLNGEAFMHNRARMIVASFLVKDLLIDYRWGERYFMQQLACGDLAANNAGWQWIAGCGNDAQPFFRVFNPVSQGQKFDPRGIYVRRYVPELAKVPDSFIHEPWKMSALLQEQSGVQIGSDYPAPIIDHAVQRDEVLQRFRDLRARHAANQAKTKEES